MADKWEVVTKSKKSRPAAEPVVATNGNGNGNGNVNGSKKSAKNTLKMEDILPRDQLQSLYSQGSGNGKDAAKKSPTHTAAAASSKKSATAAAAAAAAAKSKIPDALLQPKKPKDSGAQRPRFKNLEAGFQQLNVGELQSLLESYRTSYPDSPLVWLKAIVEQLNARLNCEADPTFFGRSPNYPANIVPAPLRDLIVGTLADAGVTNVQYFFDQTLNSLVVDQSKNLPVQGFKIALQLIAFEWPQVCSQSLAKTAILRNSYQNRPPIGLGLLWAVGQGGFRDVSTGVRVWQNLLLPVLDVKAYQRFVAEYVHRVLTRAGDDALVDLSAEEVLRAYDELTAQRQGLPKEQQAWLAEAAALLVGLYVRSNQRCASLFGQLFKRLGSESGVKQQALAGALVECLERDADCLKAWRVNFRKHAAESNLLLRTLNQRSSKLTQGKEFSVFLGDLHRQLDAIPENKIDENIRETNRLVKNSQDKSAAHKARRSARGPGCLCTTLAFLVMVSAITSVFGFWLTWDTQFNGNGVFAQSKTGKLLDQAGALPYARTAYLHTVPAGSRGLLYLEANLPVWAEQTQVAVTPYVIFARDASLVAWAAAVRGAGQLCQCWHEKAPVVVAFIEQYAPGLPQKVGDASVQLWTNVRTSSVQLYAAGVQFAKTSVFVGSLSPEALNQTFVGYYNYLNGVNTFLHDHLTEHANAQ